MVRQEGVERLGQQWAPWQPGQTSSSARALLLTVLGEFVRSDGGQAWTSTLIEALSALGVEVKTARQAIARTAAAGLLQSERAGRQVRWSLTDPATRLLTEGAERIYRFGVRPEEWEGRWLVVLVSVPETNRHLRYRLRVGLEWQGFAALAPGVWICPWIEREAAAVAVLGDLGLSGQALSFRGEPGAAGDMAERVSSVWDLPALAEEYRLFLAATETKRPRTPAESFLDLVSLVHDWRHFPAADPALPEPLLPAGWPAVAAARLFHDRHDRWRRAAWQWWRAQAPPRHRP